jgi:16S rRNA (guanine966-N2)-methyltransferase
VRIIAGAWKGRKLVAPKGDATRPTADRMREALFSILTSRIGSFEGLRVADLFAGSGALGLEALSRGAAHCTFVEQDRAALDALKANAATLGVTPDVKAQSVMALSRVTDAYDLIFVDAPYGTGAGQVAIDRLLRLGWVSPATLISIETGRAEDVAIKEMTPLIERLYGKAKLTIVSPEAQAKIEVQCR